MAARGVDPARAHEERVAELERALRAEDERLERIEAAKSPEELQRALRRTSERNQASPPPRFSASRLGLLALVDVFLALLLTPLLAALADRGPQRPPVAQPASAPAVAPPTVPQPDSRSTSQGTDLPSIGEPSVFLIRATGGDARRLNGAPSHAWEPAWRPDGRALAVVADDGIVEVAASRAGPVRGQPVWRKRRELVTLSVPTLLPAYSPDATRLAFVLGGEIWMTALTRGPRMQRLTTEGTSAYPDWSPDGRAIAFASQGRVFVATAAGKLLRQVTAGPEDLAPKWSPNGLRIAFTRMDGVLHVYVMDRYGDVVRRLARDGAGEAYAAWSPDGRKLTYCKFVDGNWELVVRDLASEREQRLTRTPADESFPAWSPGGQWIAFARDLSPGPGPAG